MQREMPSEFCTLCKSMSRLPVKPDHDAWLNATRERLRRKAITARPPSLPSLGVAAAPVRVRRASAFPPDERSADEVTGTRVKIGMESEAPQQRVRKARPL
jgi:hypothetical protein